MRQVALLAVLAVSVPAAAQTSADNATLQALLAEVRQLRLALERSASLAPRIQMTLQRTQLQQDHVTRLSRQLDEMRGRITQRASEHTQLAEELKAGENRLAHEQDAQRRRDLELRIAALKAHLERQTADDSQQRAMESELAGRLQIEQSKLNELQDRLNALERQLEAPAKQP